MTTKLTLFSLITGLLLSLCLPLSAFALTGLELMQKKRDLHSVDTEYKFITMTLIDRKGRERVRELVIYSKQDEEGDNRSLLKFNLPKDIYNVGLLTWQRSGAEDDSQWLYLPASKRVKRIAGGGKKNPFMGSDLAFEDLRVEDLDANSYTLLREETINDQACWLIEAVPATAQEKKESGYGKRLIWLRKDISYPIKTEFYNRRERLIKTANYEEIEHIRGTVWRYKKLSMHTLNKNTTTLMQTQQHEIDLDIDDTLFHQNVLRRPVDIRK